LKLSPDSARKPEIIETPQKKKSPYLQVVEPEFSRQKSLSYLQLLRSYIRDNKSIHIRQDEGSDVSLNLSNIDFDKFMERLLGTGRDYNFQNWNHFSKRGQLKFNASIAGKRKKAAVTEMEFTEQEKEWKNYAEKIPIKKLSRSACLEYQYNPEYCFNSMIDVIDVTKMVTKNDPIKKNLQEKAKLMVYAPRIFNDPQDSLYQAGEFPTPAKTKAHPLHSLRLYESDFPDINANERSRKVRRIKRKMYKISKSLIKKDFYPIKGSDPAVFDTTLKMHEGFERYPMKKQGELKRQLSTKERFTNMASMSDKFLVDFVELDVKHSEMMQEHSHHLKQSHYYDEESEKSDDSSDLEPEEWYEGIMQNEKNKEEISQVNWSGEQVKITSGFSRHKMEVTVDSLNLQDIEIWLTGWSGFHKTIRKKLRLVMGHRYTVRFLLFCVTSNTLILTLDGIVSDNVSNILTNFNTFFTIVFWASYTLSLWGYGWSFLRSYFNIFDGVVVILSLVELTINLTQDNGQNGGSAISAFRALRILRVFRVLRVTRILRSLKFITVIITVITETVEQYFFIAIMLLLFLLIYALLGMQIYSGLLSPNLVLPRANYDTFSNSFLTVLQLVTFENWTDHIVLLYNTPVSKAITLAYIISWLIIGNYIFLNLFLALLLGGFESEEVIKSLQETVDEFKELKEQIKKQNLKMTRLIHELEEKKIRESKNINFIINTDIKQQIYEEEAVYDVLTEEKLKNRGTYFLERGYKNEESSLEELLYETLEESTNVNLLKRNATLKKREIYLDVYCHSSLYVFPRKHALRRFAATIVSHSW
jgi:hypothetical protein